VEYIIIFLKVKNCIRTFANIRIYQLISPLNYELSVLADRRLADLHFAELADLHLGYLCTKSFFIPFL
jgi:hypothetical protein